ncbi:hypothetical protein ACLOJK_038615 [Asimina triloba]
MAGSWQLGGVRRGGRRARQRASEAVGERGGDGQHGLSTAWADGRRQRGERRQRASGCRRQLDGRIIVDNYCRRGCCENDADTFGKNERQDGALEENVWCRCCDDPFLDQNQ